ncbi:MULTISPECIES: magnesium transporter [Acinetobacter]|uniref:Magnesium transporter MgtE n=1 Tax=Acinetobacter radioresistens TaxID=40216 RepID=A0A8H2PSA8_ACIRA|nr:MULTISPECIES: magnesium transporter [Acinetobacter]ENV88523.1 magnesium transporter [Acinetobacter radioresistens DSM 6976 = NBRC 102413 = CIP 103788]EXB70065.1 magnesium transporter [Acinetobacter sp. 230853]EXE14107.1 magnesium transporter [Acinetobacter sp. 983759]MCU4518086.1 magnesium transporter [Acinetobacter radioresistens]PKD86921.1 magnesium transporter [Acinetobacter radioresistens]
MPQIAEKIQYVRQQLRSEKFNTAIGLLNELNIADQASVLKGLTPTEQVKILQKLDEPSEAFAYLPLSQQAVLAEFIPVPDLIPILDNMYSDDFVDIYKKLSPELKQQLITLLSEESQNTLRKLALYPEGTAGAMMSSSFVTLHQDLCMDEAIQALRIIAATRETLYLVYIVNEQNQLIGVISLRQIIQARPEATIAEVMERDVIYVYTYDDQEVVAKTLAYYDLIALPVVDEQERMLGIITYDDVMDIVEAETTEDILKSGAVSPLAELSLKTAPIITLYQKRVFWLVILVFGSLLSGIGIAHFEEIISTHIVLVFFLPLLVGSGGNAGSQSATLMVRALATGDVQFKDWFSLLGRETVVALCLGVTMACAVSMLGYIRSDLMVAIVLAISMVGIVLMGCLTGMSLPFILNKLKLDPASASAPLVTSICDATGVIIYLFVASKLLF